MADMKKLKTAGKGQPPLPSDTNDNLKSSAASERTSLQLSVPVEMFEEFSREAGRRFGYKKGSKVNLFMAVWENYMQQRG